MHGLPQPPAALLEAGRGVFQALTQLATEKALGLPRGCPAVQHTCVCPDVGISELFDRAVAQAGRECERRLELAVRGGLEIDGFALLLTAFFVGLVLGALLSRSVKGGFVDEVPLQFQVHHGGHGGLEGGRRAPRAISGGPVVA